jgi:hypothetical protein
MAKEFLSDVRAVGSLTGGKGLQLPGTTAPMLVNGSAGSSGQVLTSAGAGATPTWQTASGSSFTLIASSSFTSAPSFTSIPQTYKSLYAVIVFTNTAPFSGSLQYTVNGVGTGFSRFQPGVSSTFTNNATAIANLTLASTPPVPSDSYWVQINNYTASASRSIGSGSVFTFSNVITNPVTSFAFQSSATFGSSTGTAYLYGVN